MAEYSGVNAIDERERAARDEVFSKRDSLTRKIAEIEDRLKELHVARLDLQERLSVKLGIFGLTYDPESNRPKRVDVLTPEITSISNQSPIELPEMPPLPELPEMPEDLAPLPPEEPELMPPPLFQANEMAPFVPKDYGVEESGRTKPKRAGGVVTEIFLWIAAGILGAFVGYSLAMLAGFAVKADERMLYGSLVVGAMLIWVMKATISGVSFWTSLKRREGALSTMGVMFAVILVTILILSELTLAATALQKYAADRDPRNPLSVWNAVLMAACISSPILIWSGFTYWWKGHDSADAKKVESVDREKFETAKAKAFAEHRLQFENEEAKRRAEYDAKVKTYEDELEDRRQRRIADWEQAKTDQRARYEREVEEHRAKCEEIEADRRAAIEKRQQLEAELFRIRMERVAQDEAEIRALQEQYSNNMDWQAAHQLMSLVDVKQKEITRLLGLVNGYRDELEGKKRVVISSL